MLNTNEEVPKWMCQLVLFPYIVRDRKYKNGHLKILAKTILKGEDFGQYLDFPNEDKYQKWLQEIEEELK